MGCRSCEKPEVNYKKGLWSTDEDQRLRDHILNHGASCWSAVPAKAGLQRNGKSCRLRWINYLRPGLKHGNFSREEEEIVINLQAKLGNKWSQIAMHLPGRTDNEVKNQWNSHLKKRVITKSQRSSETTHSSATSSSDCSNYQSLVGQEEQPKVLLGDYGLSSDKNISGDSLFNFEEAMGVNPWQSSVEQANDHSIFNAYGGACNMYGEIEAQAAAVGQNNITDINGLFDLLYPGVVYDKMSLGD